MNLLELWLSVAAILLISFPLGFLLTTLRRHLRISAVELAMVPVYLAVGMSGFTILLYAFSFWQMNLQILLGLIVTTWAVLLILMMRGGWSLRQAWMRVRSKITGHSVRDAAAFGMALAFAVSALSLLLAKRGVTPPPGDPVSHATQVALLLRNNGFHSTGASLWDAFASVTAFYPKGFHVSGAATSLITGLYPGEAVLVLGTAIAVLIPLVVYSFVYLKTRNSALALAGSLLILILPVGDFDPLQFVVYAYYVYGVYPFLYGLLIILTFFLIGYSKQVLDQPREHPGLVIALGVLAIGAVLASYYYLVLLAIYGLSILSIIFARRKTKRLLFLPILIVPIAILLAFHVEVRNSVASFVRVRVISDLKLFWVPIDSFSATLFGIIVFAAFALAILVLIRRKHVAMATGFSLFAVLLFAAMVSETVYFDYLWPLLPRRMAIPLVAFGIIALIVFAWSAVAERKKAERVIPRVAGTPWARGLGPVIGAVLVTMIFLAGSGYSGAQIGDWGFPRGDDYDALVWISQHVPEEDLILNDRSFMGLYLPSFGIKNIVHLRELDYSPSYTFQYGFPMEMLTRVHETGAIFDDPDNRTLIRSLVEKWQIMYIFVGSEAAYYDYWYDQRYEWREHDSSVIMSFFDANSDLRPMFRGERAGVYATFLV